jgi:hypothetical protein
MKRVRKIATLALTMFAVSAPALAATIVPENLVRGFIGPASSNGSWANYTVVNLIPGSALFPVTSTTTVFYFGFTAGTGADITNMVLYTTARGGTTITAVTPVKLGGTSSPTILLSNASVCPAAPSTTTPCVVKFDPLTLTLSPANDYYLAVYFTASDSNNTALGAAQAGTDQSSVVGGYFGGNDTGLVAGDAIPGVPNAGATFLMYVMNE